MGLWGEMKREEESRGRLKGSGVVVRCDWCACDYVVVAMWVLLTRGKLCCRPFILGLIAKEAALALEGPKASLLDLRDKVAFSGYLCWVVSF
ncbi:Uncharacterized protein TCM_010937 [Theobroma cacao]|uniref:Uncharacterized protein n=1 Tax=Theobroma cacao TaxID=3641 RepID=A0A061E7R7_THECC|nr:Uncharacterized protein TCM_010937 [Theobroma cacao]